MGRLYDSGEAGRGEGRVRKRIERGAEEGRMGEAKQEEKGEKRGKRERRGEGRRGERRKGEGRRGG